MNIHSKENLHTYGQAESFSEALFTGLVMLGACAVVVLMAALMMKGA